MNYYKQYEPIFGSWHITRLIGEGSFGKVFEMERQDFGVTYKAALKAITVPASETELRDVMADGMDEESVRSYYSTFVQDLVKEFALMSRLKGNSNIVSYENHQVIEHKEGIGWDILIQMELLTPLNEYTRKNTITRQDVIRLGIDMCKALELCQKYNIIHRDVKPENMFISDNGDFKLGDFGIARTVEKTTSGLSKKGTYTYMAPEVYKGEAYGSTVDIYSLGIVLYRLLNENRTPFLPAYPAPITHSDRENALAKRFSGAPIPPPSHADGRLAEIVLKACAYDPKERYSVPLRMREDLEAILYNREESQYIYPERDEVPQKSVQYVRTGDEPPVAESDPTQKDSGPVSDMGSAAERESDGTVSDFGQVSPGGFDASRTESVFGGGIPWEEGTSKTESIFGAPPVKEKEKHTMPVKTKKSGGKKKVIAIVAAGLVLAVAGSVLFLNHRAAQAKKAEYEQLMQEGTERCATSPDIALMDFKLAGNMFPEEPAPKVSYAYALYLNREYEDCITYIEDELGLGKAFDIGVQSQLSAILGAAYFELGDYAQAASFFRLSTAGGDITVSAQRDYAVSLGRLKDFEAADQVLQEMISAGADDLITMYVQAEVDYAREAYLDAERGFLSALELTSDRDLKNRAMRSLAQLYLDCSALVEAGNSPIDTPATKAAELIGTTASELRYAYNDAPLYELQGQAFYEAYHVDHGWAGNLRNAASCFERAIELGGPKEYLYRNIFTATYEYIQAGNYTQPSYEQAENVLDQYEEAFPASYIPHALRAILYINVENEKPQDQRDYTAAVQEYSYAEAKCYASDDKTYLQMVESLIKELERNGWL